MQESIGRGRRVLVVDDEEAIRTVLSRFLGGQGFQVETADGFHDALAQCAARSFDLLILDKNLPDGSGLELARRLESQDHELVIITGYPNIASAIEAMRYNVADYLVKPFDFNEITTRLSRVLTLQDLKRRNRQLIDELQEKNQALALDPLTQLYNRAYFQDALQKEVLRSRRHDLEFALLFVDIDRFKDVNDSRGHLTGDRVLIEFAEVLRGGHSAPENGFRMRETDIAARYGGDEFALVLPETSKTGAAIKAESLRSYIEEHDFSAKGLPHFTLSIGVAGFPDDAEDPAGLIGAADRALYAAKESGRNLIMTYMPALSRDGRLEVSEAHAEAARMEGLERAMAQRSFEYHYQPIVDAETWSIYGYEALCRPTDATFADPKDLIAIAERAGRVSNLGRVLREVCIAPIEVLPMPAVMFVNLHPQELNDPMLLDLEPTLRPWTNRVVFEITETARIKEYGRARDVMTKLRSHGFRIALDDLGAGYAGLNCLAQLEPDFVKLDIGMIHGIHASDRSARLIKHLLEFARGEGMQVIAEGIETEEEVRVVTDLGVPLLQGFYFARPGPAFVGAREKKG
jgi:diguanylate cyclase (GGDEF)-like protein